MFYSWKFVEKEHAIYVLEKLRDLFTDQSRWVYWPNAVDAKGNGVDPSSPDAAAWSLMGAADKIATEKYGSPLGGYIECSIREFLDDLSDNKQIRKSFGYDDEYALICAGLEFLVSMDRKESK